MNVKEHQVAASPQTKPTNLGFESASKLLSSTATLPFTHFTIPQKIEG